MVGHIAYSLYKAEKVQYIKEKKEAMKVDILPEKVVQEFTAGRDNNKSLEHYRGMAETILQRFIGGSFDDMSGQVIAEVTDRLTQHMDANITPLLPQKESWWIKFWNGCLQSIGGAIALSVIVWLFANVVGKFSLGDISVTYGNNNKLDKTVQVAVPTEPSDSMIVEEVKPQEVIAPVENIKK